MLGGIDATDFDVELVATVAGGDDDGLAGKGSQWFQDCFVSVQILGHSKF